MNPWFGKAVILAASVVMILIRAPHGHRSRTIKIIKDRKGRLEVAVLSFAMLGFFIPLVWVASPAFAFAEYPLRLGPFVGGILCFAAGLWLFYRSHADLGANWSITLQVRENHRLITEGVYRRIRHPMYSSLFLYSIGQALALPNWFAGSSYLVTFGFLFLLRVRVEERMMLEEFGDEYAAYMARTRRLAPGIW
ncbi:MAG: isoprenylcysteine carboxylmethyltransferase family protein [Verrucomicrobia bacterium]|nr:isoprenylcysteine carboxylmethyltransferase family protein [Verrucomicrobiota bacterium]